MKSNNNILNFQRKKRKSIDKMVKNGYCKNMVKYSKLEGI